VESQKAVKRGRKLITAAIIAAVVFAAGLSLWRHSSAIGISFVRGSLAKLTSAQVEVNDVVFSFDGAVRIKGISIRPNVEKPGYDDTVFRAGQVDAKFGIWAMIFQKLKLRKIIVKDFVIDVQYDADMRRWNAGLLKFVAGAGSSPHVPDIILESGSLRYTKIAASVRKELLNIPINSRLECVEQNTEYLKFRVLTSDKGDEKGSDLIGIWRTGAAGKIDLDGRISWANFSIFDNYWSLDDLHLRAEYDANTFAIKTFTTRLGASTTIECSGKIENYRVAPQFAIRSEIKNLYHTSASIPNALVYSQSLLETINNRVCRKFFKNYGPTGWVDVEIEAEGNFSDIKQTRCRGILTCKDVSVQYANFPYKLDKLAGTIDFTNSQVKLNSIKGKHKDVDVMVSGFARDIGETWDADIQLQSQNMILDDDLYEALNSRAKQGWLSLSPKGTIGVDFRFVKSADGKKSHTTGIELKNTSAVFHYMPYPLNNLTGRLLIDEANEIHLKEVRCSDGEKQIVINGLVKDANNYEILLSGKNIPMDRELVSALSERQKQLFKKYGLSGVLDIEASVKTGEAAKYRALIKIQDGTIKCGDFFDFQQAQVRAVLTDNWIGLENLTGNYQGCRFKLAGQIWPDPNGYNSKYDLAVEANELELKDELLGRIPQAVSALKNIKLAGPINFRTRVEGDSNSFSVKDGIAIECLGNDIQISEIPYVFTNVRGNIHFADQKVTISGLSARVGGADANEFLRCSGQAQIANGKFAGGIFHGDINDIKFDSRLRRLLPAVMRGQFDKYDPKGLLSAHADELFISRNANDINSISFKGHLGFKDCSVRSNIPVEHLTAGLDITAEYCGSDNNFKADAKLSASRMFIKDRLFENGVALLHYNDKLQILEANDFAADICGGRIAGDVKLQGKGYSMEAVFDKILVNDFIFPGRLNAKNYISGAMSGSIRLSVPTAGGTRSGYVLIETSDMHVEKVSFLGKVLLVMKFTEPTDYAFDEMSAAAYLSGDELLIDRLDLRGRSLTMRGEGSIHLKPANVNLAFTAAGPRSQNQPSMLESLAEGMIPAIVRVTVKGPLEDPVIEKTALPVIADTLGILGKPIQKK